MRPSGPPRGAAGAFRPKKDPLLDASVLDDATRRALLDNLGRQRPPVPAQRAVATGPGGDVDVAMPAVPTSSATDGEAGLNAMVFARLNTLEKQAAVQQKELREKAARIVSLEDHLADAKRRLEKSEHEKEVLAHRLADMNKFLADYNMAFVGSARECSSGERTPEHNTHAPPSKPFDLFAGNFDAKATDPTATHAANKPLPLVAAPAGGSASDESHNKLPFDLELATYHADRLSASIANKTVQTNGRTGVIKERDTVYVCVYADGICVNSGLFRPYGWPLCDAFLSDLLDGYFPYEFKDRYHDGFPIQIIDKSGEKCPRDAPTNNVHHAGDHGYKPVGREALLRRLPQQYVTASGKLINLQAGVSDFIGGDGKDAFGGPAEPQRLVAQTEAEKFVTSGNSPSKHPLTTIRVKFAQGHDVTLRMFHDDTVGKLRAELLRASSDFFTPTTAFELCSVYPRKTYTEHDESLAAAGLVPSAALQIKLVL
jgi:hypothetical protein